MKHTTLSSQAGLELSAKTASLVATPDPYGKPGGPGLYGKKGMKHSNYFEHIVHAMIRNGKTPAEASQMAWGILRRWARGGGHVTPQVKAAAIAALAEEKAKGAAAKASHSHSNFSEYVFELSGTTAGAAKHQRVPAGKPGGGEFTKPSGNQTSATTKAKVTGTPAKATPAASSSGKVVTPKLTPQQKQQVKNLQGQVQKINTNIKQIDAAIVADKKARQAAAQAVAAAKKKGTTTTSGGSTAASSSSGGTTSTTAAASTPAAQAASSSPASSSSPSTPASTTTAVKTANTKLVAANNKLKADNTQHRKLVIQRDGIVKQIQKIEGKG